MYKSEARKLMAKCQDAVPAWIMTIGKALESLNPRTNKFDMVLFMIHQEERQIYYSV